VDSVFSNKVDGTTDDSVFRQKADGDVGGMT